MSDSAVKPNLESEPVRPPLWAAIVPVALLIVLLAINVYLYGEDSSYGANQIALLIAAAVAAGLGLIFGNKTAKMLEGIKSSIASALIAMLILLLIGALAGTWMMSGIVPAMIYYGLDVLNPKTFLVATVVICSIVSVATGSSWSTVATVGIALLAIGKALGANEAVTAGAIISGAYFGDKISPLSDTTNLAAAMAKTDLITHIKYMLWTTVPSILIASGIFLVIGLRGSGEFSQADTEALKTAIGEQFHISYFLLLVPLAVIVMVVCKVDAVVALFVGAVLGGIVMIFAQPQVVEKIATYPEHYLMRNSKGLSEEEIQKHRQAQKDSALGKCIGSYTAFTNTMFSDGVELISGDAREKIDAAVEKTLKEEQEKQGDNELTVTQLMKMPIDPEVKGNYFAAKLLKGKGMVGMLNTIWLILCAMCFGGVMQACGFLKRITEPLLRLANSNGSLTATTAGSCLFTNFTASDQYLAIVVPGQMFRETYEERGLAPQNLSRTLEDTGTVTSVLIPWNTCGATQAGVLGVATIAFAPFCFFNIISPFMNIAYGYFGIGIAKLKETDEPDAFEDEETQV